MRRLTQWIVSKCVRDYEKTDNLKVRARYGLLEGWSSIVVNLILFAVKGGIGVAIGSIALIADAVHTIGDCVTSAVVIVGFKICATPSDKEHPFGHGRMEAVAALIISVLLMVVGFEFFRSSFDRLIHPTHVEAGVLVAVLLVGTILLKEALTQFAKHLADMIQSKTLEADFWHHRSDVIATALVVVALIASDFGWYRLDGVGGVLVSIIVMYTGYGIARDAISPLLGAPPSREMLKQIETVAKGITGVMGVHDVIVHQYGPTNLVSLHIEVADDQPAFQLHEISEEVEAKVGGNVHGMVVVHIDPLSKNHKRYPEVSRAIGEIITGHEKIVSFHDLRIVGRRKGARVIFDIIVREDTDEMESYDIRQDVIAHLKQKFSDLDFVVRVEPRFAYQV